MSNRYLGGIISAGATSGIQTPPSTVEYLVVAGGGAGGAYIGGGGGAGGLLTAAGYSVTTGSAITVTIGAGGSGQISADNTFATNGSISIFGTITTVGGGFGCGRNGQFSAAGGSGGGARGGGGGGSPGAGTSGQGFAGGADNAGTEGSTGGGGSGSVGASQKARTGGNGGAGTVSTITGYPVQYAGGGGGSADYQGIKLDGGYGCAGGSDGIWIGSSLSAKPNSGSGSGGVGRPHYLGGSSGNGGSGIVVIRYPSYQAPAKSTTGSPSTYVSGPWRVYIFINSGTITF